MWDVIVSVPDHCLSFYFSNSSDRIESSEYTQMTVQCSMILLSSDRTVKSIYIVSQVPVKYSMLLFSSDSTMIKDYAIKQLALTQNLKLLYYALTVLSNV